MNLKEKLGREMKFMRFSYGKGYVLSTKRINLVKEGYSKNDIIEYCDFKKRAERRTFDWRGALPFIFGYAAGNYVNFYISQQGLDEFDSQVQYLEDRNR